MKQRQFYLLNIVLIILFIAPLPNMATSNFEENYKYSFDISESLYDYNRSQLFIPNINFGNISGYQILSNINHDNASQYFGDLEYLNLNEQSYLTSENVNITNYFIWDYTIDEFINLASSINKESNISANVDLKEQMFVIKAYHKNVSEFIYVDTEIKLLTSFEIETNDGIILFTLGKLYNENTTFWDVMAENLWVIVAILTLIFAFVVFYLYKR